MKLNLFFLMVTLTMIFSCQQSTLDINNPQMAKRLDAILDSVLPMIAKGHDTIPKNLRFLPQFKPYYDQQKIERHYQWLNYLVNKDSFEYFLIKRDEPSMKRDKFLAIGGRFKRMPGGEIDFSSYEELFWTWKMHSDELQEKAQKLFVLATEGGDLNAYTPEHSEGEWIEFPGNGVVYDRKNHAWVNQKINAN